MKTKLFLLIIIFFYSCSDSIVIEEGITSKKNTSKTNKNTSKIDSNISPDINYQPEEKDSLNRIIDSLKTELLNKENPIIVLNKKTYIPNNNKQVQDILNSMYNESVIRLKRSGFHDTMLTEEYKMFFSIEKCNPLILEFIDKQLDIENIRLSKRFKLTSLCMSDTITNVKQLISFK